MSKIKDEASNWLGEDATKKSQISTQQMAWVNWLSGEEVSPTLLG